MPIDHNCSEWIGKYNCLIWELQKEGQCEGKALKLLIVSDQCGVILTVMTWLWEFYKLGCH